ncbi:hypothetical protein POM88_044192 [Heracleum sosnowskyi]|uniref:Protein FAR1-RELATED SEQUENCE n=1 Tax=Heracleum sosnowskyi TaxID=360622 RepID=A0AAD8M564_9APIA|nr:hypothetical protein POM88_044192 [Heracleum sosnowskyi]
MLPVLKRGKGCQPDHDKDEQAILESSLNKLVGAADMYNLEEMEPPITLMCDLRPYQKQALYWMTELEKGVDAQKATKTLHPCWAAYRLCDERASYIHVNVFSGEATTQFPYEGNFISFGEAISDVSNTYFSTDNEEVESGCMVTPGGHRYYVPISVEDNLKLFISQSCQSLESSITFYSEYKLLSRFTVCRSAGKTHSDGTIISKYLVCNRAGFSDVKMSCPEGSKSKEAHNHPLVPEDSRHFLKGNRKMSTCSMNFVFDASKVNIGTMKSFRMMKELVKSYENVGATSREFRNFDRDLKAFVGVADAQMIIDKFKVKQETDPCFFNDVDVDPDGNLTKLFWADSTARRNYKLYGDAVSFDPTFNTNK